MSTPTPVTIPVGIRPYGRQPAPTTYDTTKEASERGNVERAIPYAIGLIEVSLTANTTISLDVSVTGRNLYAGQSGFLEVTQDATGGHAFTVSNATGNTGAFPQPATGPNDVTMYQWVWNGSTFVFSLFASGYSASGLDVALAAALSRMTSAYLPLPRVEVLVDGYAVVFA